MSGSSSSLSLLDLGFEVVYEILANLPPLDLLRVRQVCRTLKTIADDDVLWRRHLLNDFHFPLHSSARLSGWRQLYKGMARPHLWVWGDASDDRLGIGARGEIGDHLRDLVQRRGGVPFPLELPHHREPRSILDDQYMLRDITPNERFNLGSVVELHPGGWSFVYLTSEGYLLASGKLSTGYVGIPDRRLGFRNSVTPWLDEPTLLFLKGKRVLKVACGGSHLVTIVEDRDALPDEGTPPEIIVWREWTDRHSFSLAGLGLGQTDAGAFRRIEQLENGWDFTAILVHEVSTANNSRAYSQDHNRTATSQVFLWLRSWDHDVENGIELPPLPSPPQDLVADFDETSEDPNQGGGHHLITRIGGGEGFVVALTASGLVYKIAVDGPDAAAIHVEAQRYAREMGQEEDESLSFTRERQHAAQRRLMSRRFASYATQWQLLRHFCEPQRILEAAPDVWQMEEKAELVQKSTRMTHLTAHFRQFVVYSAKGGSGAQGWRSLVNAPREAGDSSRQTLAGGGGIVLLGQHTDVASSKPEVKPVLQGADIIKVVAGDWHYGALDAHGNVFTWGQWSKGALGTYDQFQPKGEAKEVEASQEDREGTTEGSSRSPPSSSPPPPQARPSIFQRLRGAMRSSVSPAPSTPYYHSQDDSDAPEPVRTAGRSVPSRVPEPLRVCFDSDTAWEEGLDELPHDSEAQEEAYWVSEKSRRGKDHFVFDIGFAGWHSGALSLERKLLQQ